MILFGERIKYLRKQKNITQENLAGMVNRSKNHISKIEVGCANPPFTLIVDIANALKDKRHKEAVQNILHILVEKIIK